MRVRYDYFLHTTQHANINAGEGNFDDGSKAGQSGTATPAESDAKGKKVRIKGGMRGIEKRFSLVEGLNGCNLHHMNTKSIHWARMLNKGMTAGSDGHTTAELGNSLCLAYGFDVDSFLEAVKRGYSILLGKEENLFVDLIHQIIKEKIYLKHAKEMGKGMFWVKEHFKEFEILRRKHKKFGDDLHHHYDLQHQAPTEENKRFMKSHYYYTQVGRRMFK